jgi:large subunit ribosomal protein L30
MADTKLKITLQRSVIGTRQALRDTVRALGLRKRQHSVVHTNTPQIRGMLNKVQHLVEIETIED